VGVLSIAAFWTMSEPIHAQQAASPPKGYDEVAKPFIKQHCLECHGEKTAKAGYRIDLIGTDFSAATVADHWKEVIDRINAGEMPPKEKTKPDANQVAEFVSWVNEQLRQVDLAAKNAGGRIPMRRLNRDEYANTVRDLLKLDELVVRPLIEDLPSDGQAEGFDRLGVALFFDQTQIERSLGVAEKLVARAIVTSAPKENSFTNKFDLLRKKPPPDMVEVFPGFAHTIPRGARDVIVHPNHIEHIQGYPTYRREYDGWGAISHFAIGQVVTQDGYYRVRIKAKVDDRARTEPNKFRLQYAVDSPIYVEQEVPVDPSGTTETLLFLRGPVNGEVKGPQVFRLLWNHTEKAVINEPNYKKLFSRWTALRGRTEEAVARRVPQKELDELKKQRDELEKELNAWEGPAYIYNPEMDLEKLPRLLIESIEITGPVQKEWPPVSHKSLLFAGDERSDSGYVREVFAKFLPRAYRRPVTAEEVEAIVAIVEDAQATSKLPFLEGMRVGLQRVLCSPGFLFLHEPSSAQTERRPLNDGELASRLSYFLWSTMPDDELFELAASGKLHEPAIIDAQVRRMLADPKAEQLVRNFGGQWLSVREYGAVQPAAEYRDYDKLLEAASKHEPLAFFAEVLSKNLAITNFLDSDFVVINDRLAKHYGIDGVEGTDFRRVAIQPEHHRGGVLGMAGLMTFLADGTRTLPMRRGSWVLRELFNDPPNNPPPNAGEIQPNTSGKNLTVRERLDLHRRDSVCASCHAKLDPFGLALENYDAIGKWRERFNGEGFRGERGPVLNVSGELLDGTKFSTLADYKAILMSQKDRFARAFAVKLLTYALGRPIGYTDREVMDSLVAALQENDYQIQSLIHAIVASEPFRTK
jgi:mono/diheme cytochrome c family protein